MVTHGDEGAGRRSINFIFTLRYVIKSVRHSFGTQFVKYVIGHLQVTMKRTYSNIEDLSALVGWCQPYMHPMV